MKHRDTSYVKYHWVVPLCVIVLLSGLSGMVWGEAPSAAPLDGGAGTASAERVGQPQRRVPPRVAVDACVGKKEGDPCSFSFREGNREGECLSGVENIFACRPHPGGRPAEAGRDGVTKPQEQSKPAVVQEQKNPQVQPAASASSQPSHQAAGTVAPATSREVPPPTAPLREAVGGDNHAALNNPASAPESTRFDTSLLLYCLGSALVAAGVTWYLFFRVSTVPLRRLRRVTQQLAGGDLTARVGEGLVHRKDEVADLGRDVDRMAERIEGLVASHQRLIRDVSHELRSPLARLNVALELARQSAGAGHAAPFDRIERESDRLNELIGQLLMLTKLESENSMNQRGPVDIAALIRDISQDVDFEAQSNRRGVHAEDGGAVVLNGNKELLRQALENLVRNAARYTAEGTAVEISLRRRESNGRSWAHIEVRDYGPGVPESALFDIFRPFYRVGDARERQSGGAGVGLAISDRAVRLHGGSLRAYNAVGGGLIMEVELPLTST